MPLIQRLQAFAKRLNICAQKSFEDTAQFDCHGRNGCAEDFEQIPNNSVKRDA